MVSSYIFLLDKEESELSLVHHAADWTLVGYSSENFEVGLEAAVVVRETVTEQQILIIEVEIMIYDPFLN